MSKRSINRISRNVVVALSLFAMLLVMAATLFTLLGRFDPAPGGDEGLAAHLFQFAVVLILPAGVVYLGTADWDHPVFVAKRLLLPAAALAVAFATLYCMEHLL
jgi:hypothetical protein